MTSAPSARAAQPNGSIGVSNSSATRAAVKHGLQHQPTETLAFLAENEILQLPGFISSGTAPYAE